MSRFIAIGAPRAAATRERLQPLMRAEIETVWRAYRSDLIREIYERADSPGVVMICEAESADTVEQMLASLPMSEAGLLDTQVIALKPFEMWTALFSEVVD